MDKILQSVFLIGKELFDTHIKTKTTDPVFHPASPQFYEFAILTIYHKWYERAIDLGLLPNVDCETAREDNLDALIRLQAILEGQIKKSNSIGMDNLLRGMADDLEDLIGNAKAFVAEEKEEEIKPTSRGLKPMK